MKKLISKVVEKVSTFFKSNEGGYTTRVIYNVSDGPYHYSEIDGVDRPTEDANFMVVALMSDSLDSKEMYDQDIWFESLDEAYDIANYFKANIKPLEFVEKVGE